jgi:hypothetical protein
MGLVEVKSMQVQINRTFFGETNIDILFLPIALDYHGATLPPVQT